uniref:ABC transporter domain-containing protein n=1 Tax=Macrostomum lignano TaxID=282301 RepID=A0A1I8J4R1_9PLAT
ANGTENSEFNDVQFFTLKDFKDFNNNDDKIINDVELKRSKCSEWIIKGLPVFDDNLEVYIEASLSLSTIGIALYFLVATAFRMRAIKQNGFLKQLFLSGLSVTSYWTVIWLITLVECLVFSGFFVMSYVLQCPGIYPAKNVLCVFLVLNLYCLVFWFPEKAKDDDRVHLSNKVVEDPAVEVVTGLSVSIIADRISKSYDNCCGCWLGPEVLHRMSCLVYRDQVTALVGHSTSGKSTMLKILTGDEQPTSGTAYVAGFRVTDPLERLAARGVFSVCPQIDSLCGSLTSMECIEAALISRGANFPSELDRARVMLEQLQVRGIETAKTRELSASQKRKLSTVIALLADPDVVFLDEPTNGLDPISALQLWGLLQEEKQGRSIVVCTESMHEADLLADRKMILCDGDLVCAGTSQFLQRLFGCRATLNVKLKREKDFSRLLMELPQTRLKQRKSVEVQLEVKDSGSLRMLDEVVKKLENSKDIVASFSVSQTTIGDVFKKLDGMTISEFSQHLRSGKLSEYLEDIYNDMSSTNPDLSQSQTSASSVSPSSIRRFGGIFIINMKRQLRSAWQIVGRIVLPLIFLLSLSVWCPLMMSAYNSQPKIDSVKEMQETDTYSGLFGVKSQTYSKATNLRIVCMRDSEIVETYDTEFCRKLQLMEKTLVKPRIILKPKTESMKKFLQQPSTIRQLRQGCKGIEDVMPPCIVYYSTVWNQSFPNNQRSISIGVFLDANSVDDTSHALRRGFAKISQFFGAGDVKNTTALSNLLPFSQYGYFNIEILLLFAFFCLFSASFIRDVVEDITSNVQLQFLATAYVIASLSTSSLAVTTVCYQIFTLLMQWILVTMHLQGIPLFALLIFLLPSVAPFSTAYFGMIQVIYKLEYYHLKSISDISNVYVDVWSNNIFYLLSIAAMLVHLIILSRIMILIRKWDVIHYKFSKTGNYNDLDIDAPKNSSVDTEEKRLLKSLRNRDNVLEIAKLRKTYPNGVEAVRGVTFGVMTGEILGLLGSSGAGKSSLLSVIVGKEKPTEGTFGVRSRNANWQLNSTSVPLGAVGYCPQYCPLYDSITMSEHLILYARILGVPSALAERQSISLMSSLGLLNRQHSRTNQLSIGEKRRLCLAIALLGNPALVVIDEATAGVDPKARGLIRGAVVALRNQSRAVLLSTRRLEQADALCDRVGVLNRGRMIALNTVQSLSSLFDEAYTLELTMERVGLAKLQQNKQNLKGSLAVIFEGTSVLNDWGQCVQICVPKSATGGVLNVLGWLANNTKLLGVQRYTMRQMSFDESLVFLAGRFDPPKSLRKQAVIT